MTERAPAARRVKVLWDPRTARKWTWACVVLGALLAITVILVAADVVPGVMLMPPFVWFLLAVGGALLYKLRRALP